MRRAVAVAAHPGGGRRISPAGKPAKETILERCAREYERVERVWRPVWDAIIEERRFYEGQHFEQDRDPHQRDRRDFYVITQDTFNVVRHKAARLTDEPFQIEPRPVDGNSDSEDAEFAGALLRWETDNPQKMFDDYCDMMAVSAIAARIGLIWIDYDPDMGAWGEILFRPGDAAKTAWEPGYHDPHDLGCGYVVEDRYLSLATLRADPRLDRKVLDALHAEARPVDEYRPSVETGPDQGDDGVLTRWWWWKNDRSVKEQSPEPGTLVPFADPGDRYMACASPAETGCGWHSQPQAMANPELDHEAGAEFPEYMPQGCPQCGGDLWRVDGTKAAEDVLIYPRGRRLTIEVPNQRTEKPLYDDKWPVPQARSVPLYCLSCYLPADPTKVCGPSDTALKWTEQVAGDLLLTKSFLALDAYQRYFAVPLVGVYDWNGKAFQFRDDQYNVLYYDEERWSTPPKIDAIEGPALDPSVPAFFGMLRGASKGVEGIADLGLTEQNSKNIPATTVMQMNKLGELPVEHLRRRYHRALARGHGVLSDYQRGTYPAARLARLNLPEMGDVVRWLRADNLPNFDFVVSASPTFDGLEKSKSEALMTLIGLSKTAPEWLDLVAEVNGFPPSIVRKVKQKQKALGGALLAQPGQAGGGPDGDIASADAPPEGPQGMSPLAQMAAMGMQEMAPQA